MNAARRTPTVLLVLALVALTAVGCGVKEKDGVGTGGDGTETTAPATTEAAPDTTEDTPDTTEPSDTTEDTPDTTDGSTDTTIPDFGDFGKDDLVKLYTDMGLSEAQATCLVDTIFESTTGGDFDPSDQSAIFDYLARCEIDITDFGGMNGN